MFQAPVTRVGFFLFKLGSFVPFVPTQPLLHTRRACGYTAKWNHYILFPLISSEHQLYVVFSQGKNSIPIHERDVVIFILKVKCQESNIRTV